MRLIPDEKIFEFIDAVTYKPGWTFGIKRDFAPYQRGWTLVARVPVEDADRPGQKTKLMQTRTVPEYMFETDLWMQHLAHEVWRLVEDLEGHERLEWLKLEGQWFWHPHPNGKAMSGPHGEAFKTPEATHA